MLRYFTAEEQTTETPEREEIIKEVNLYNRRYSGDPIPVRCSFPVPQLHVILIWFLLKYTNSTSLSLRLFPVDGLYTRSAYAAAPSGQRVFLSRRSGVDVPLAYIRTVRCCLALFPVALGHHPRGGVRSIRLPR